MTPVEGVLATHPIVSAIPFFVPTFVVVAVIAVVVWRDRRRGDDETDGTGEVGEGAGERAPGAGERSDAA
ncbi:hypothetical protein GCM10009678_01730 [Actinomadura kijaniata]|uniref:Uncharacterized protein n=1 Tax=Actinomadura namibiensis TaxID=182080 RepID=A0A7W3LSB6_ACTNM|nr:hypothetical protein [Actinomadura namibiensis]MBA8953302.1 hypothetical protein [Actinomadura namibiensis]